MSDSFIGFLYFLGMLAIGFLLGPIIALFEITKTGKGD